MSDDDTELHASAGKMLLEVLRRTHLSGAHHLSGVVAEEARRIGVRSLTLYVVDHEQKVLVPIPGPDTGDADVLPIQGTVAGRCYMAGSIIETDVAQGRRVWLPMLDGTERLGTIEMVFAGDAPLTEQQLGIAERYAHFVAGLIATKDPYSDVFKILRRRRSLTTATELVHEMVPPAVMATDDFVLGAMLEPTYDIGGDAYDYALNVNLLHVGIFDGVGHGLAAAGATAFALAVYRHSRRRGHDLGEAYQAIDAEVADQYPGSRYVTACLAELDVKDGHLRWISAGHPAPLLVRRGRFIKELTVKTSPPMGLRFAERPPVVAEAALEPGDMILLYTDGLTESRRPDGRLFTTERLAEFIERQAAGGEAAPETLRRLREAIIERGEGALRDDATALLIEWRGGSQPAMMPETV